MIVEMLDESSTNSTMPSTDESATTWYGVSCKSTPYRFKIQSINMMSCKTSWSCRKSSPSLTITFLVRRSECSPPKGPTSHVSTAGFMADLSNELRLGSTRHSMRRGSTGRGMPSSRPPTKSRGSSVPGGSSRNACRKRSTFFSVRSRFAALALRRHHKSFRRKATWRSSTRLMLRPSGVSSRTSKILCRTRSNEAPRSLSSASATRYQCNDVARRRQRTARWMRKPARSFPAAPAWASAAARFVGDGAAWPPSSPAVVGTAPLELLGSYRKACTNCNKYKCTSSSLAFPRRSTA
mmetsp:Transcript_85575/g.261744  ORF Transcript_85575/g.261744 Transcript_85575/m.261744 type:complete len:295 (-) Transcript_85575:1205-2089(-)